MWGQHRNQTIKETEKKWKKLSEWLVSKKEPNLEIHYSKN